MISPIVENVISECAFGILRHNPLGLFLSHLIPNSEQSTESNPLQQQATKERGGHPLNASSNLWDWEKVHKWGFFPPQERMKWTEFYSPNLRAPSMKPVSALPYTKDGAICGAGPLEQLRIKGRASYWCWYARLKRHRTKVLYLQMHRQQSKHTRSMKNLENRTPSKGKKNI